MLQFQNLHKWKKSETRTLLFISEDCDLYLAPLFTLSTNAASYPDVVLCRFQSEANWKLTPIFIAPAVWISDNRLS
jgi:hypothetical protein